MSCSLRNPLLQSLLLLTCAAVSGCGLPYPVYKQLQPETRVRVTDAAGAAVKDASVTLISNAYPYGQEHHRETLSTGEGGRVQFEGRREWRVEVLIMHGSQDFFWSLCVSKAGYTTLLTPERHGFWFDTDPTVVLVPGESSACPAPRFQR